MGVVFLDQQSIKVPKRALARVAREALNYMGRDPKRYSLTVVLVDNMAMRTYNQRFRGEDAFTDVLAFPGDGKYLGDVIISVERAKEQAPNFGFTFEKELALLVVHGVLHLLGYRDYTTEEAREMERLQGDILQEVEEKGLI